MGKNNFYLFILLGVILFSLVSCTDDDEVVVDADVDSSTNVNNDQNSNNQRTNPSNQVQANVQTTTKVFINENELTLEQVNELQTTYGNKALPGRYWYDSKSGFYGIWHGPTLGVLRAGHNFGDLPSDASNGNTNVFVNGRELSEEDVRALELLFGVQRSPDGGRLWMDSQGNIGIEGYAVPLVNLYLAYSQRSKQAKRSGGDNYWAGNFGSYGNEQGGFGYVTVDGVSVTYGS